MLSLKGKTEPQQKLGGAWGPSVERNGTGRKYRLISHYINSKTVQNAGK